MSDPQIPATEVEAVEGVILKSPKIRGYVAVGAAVLGLTLGALHQWFNGHDPQWLSQSITVYSTIIAPASLGIWKANIR